MVYRFTLQDNGSLIIANVGPQDQGMYACVGIREESTEVPQKYTAQLTLACKFGLSFLFSQASFNFVHTGGYNFVLHFTDLEDLSLSSFDPEISPDRFYVVPENSEFQMTCKPPKGIPQVPLLSGNYLPFCTIFKGNSLNRFCCYSRQE